MIKKLRNLIVNMIGRAIIAEKSSDDKNYAFQKVKYRGTTGRAEMLLPYGHHANIPKDTLAVMFRAAADSENRVAIPMSGRERIKGLEEGEVVFFHPNTKSYVWFKANGDIDIHSENDLNIDANIINIVAETINITATDTNLTSDLDLTGNYNSTGTMTNNGKDVGSTHSHTQPDTTANATVQGNTGAVV